MSAELMQSLAHDLSQRMAGNFGRDPGYRKLDQYFSGKQPLNFLSPEVRQQAGDRLHPLSINWARVIVSSIEERLDVEGFRLPEGTEVASDLIWEIWQGNNLDEWSQLGHTDAMKHGRAFGLVWGDEDAPTEPRVTIESAEQMTVVYKPGTTKITAGVKIYGDSASVQTGSQIGWLYLPDSVEKYAGSMTGGLGSAKWTLVDTLDNPLGVVPIVPLINRPRLTDLGGESELVDVIPLLDGVNKLATDMMVSSEYHAEPRRYATGMEVPREARANERLRMEVRKQWDEATKGRTWIAGKDVNFGQFPEATLDNFINAIKLLISQIAAIAGLPPHYLGLTGTDNPASADAIRSAESSLVKKALRKQRGFGGSWEQLVRLSLAIKFGVPYVDLDPRFQKLETQWADPNTPTPGAKADAAMKLVSGDQPIITVNQAREDLGYTPGQIARMVEEETAMEDRKATADVRARLALADQLIADGTPKPAAYAAVGLLAAASQMTGIGPTPTGGSTANGQTA